jgi:CRISPR-associated endonuclease Cas2
MNKKEKELTFVQKMRLFRRAGFTHRGASYEEMGIDYEEIDELSIRIKKILEINEHFKLNPGNMLYFIMYDIENNKVRTLIAKYLINKGCQRVQKSIFFAETKRAVYNEIKKDLVAVQQTYENTDSIFLVPVSTDQLRAMKVIGKNINFDIISGSTNTMFF